METSLKGINCSIAAEEAFMLNGPLAQRVRVIRILMGRAKLWVDGKGKHPEIQVAGSNTLGLFFEYFTKRTPVHL